MNKRSLIAFSLLMGVILGLAAIAVVFVRPQKAPEASMPTKNTLYVSLGDSVASGLGLATPMDTTGCGRTKEAYPYLLATALGYQLTHLACTGATLDAGINGPQLAAGEQVSQRELLFQRDPELVTLGIGANDAAWLSRLSQCLGGACGSVEDEQAYKHLLTETFKPKLRNTLEMIEKRYEGRTELLIIEYYQVFPEPGESCKDIAGLNDAALIWARELRGYLNQAVFDTVKETGIGTYAEINFSGHELCSQDPWVQGLSDPAPYHANAEGQREIARQIEKVLGKD